MKSGNIFGSSMLNSYDSFSTSSLFYHQDYSSWNNDGYGIVVNKDMMNEHSKCLYCKQYGDPYKPCEYCGAPRG